MKTPVERIEKLITQYVMHHEGDWYNDDKHVHALHPVGVLLLRRSGVEYFSGAKSYTYEQTTYDYYERDAKVSTDDGRYHYFQVTEKSVRAIDLTKARQLFDAMWSEQVIHQ